MRIVMTATLIVTGLIHLIPVTGAFGGDALASLYGIAIDDVNLQILLRHRAILFGIVGGLLLSAAFAAKLRPAAILAGLVSVASFLVIAAQVGGYNALVGRVVQVDLVALVCLLVAGYLHLRPAAA